MATKKVSQVTKKSNILLGIVVFILVYVGVTVLLKNFNKTSSMEKAIKTIDDYTQSSDWKEYSSTTGNFKILFPTYPTQQTYDVPASANTPSFKSHMYTSNVDENTVYLVGVTEYPSTIDVSKPKVNLEGAVNGSVVTSKGKLVSSNFGEFMGVPSVDYVIQADSIYMKYRAFLIKHTLYILGATSTANEFPDFEKFANSFSLINK